MQASAAQHKQSAVVVLYGHSFNSETLDKQSAICFTAYLTRFLMNHYIFLVLAVGCGDEWVCSSLAALCIAF